MMRRSLRRAVRLMLLAVWCPIALILSIVPLAAPARWRRDAVHFGTRLAARGVLVVLGIRLDVRGSLPPFATLVVANHLSWIDIAACHALWSCTFVAKHEVARWPILGRLARELGVVFVERARWRDLPRTIDDIEQALSRGERVIVFPEATTTCGKTVLPFRSALFEAAIRANVPTTSVAISFGAPFDDATTLCWVGDETLQAHLPRVAAVSRATILVTVDDASVVMPSRKPLAREARNRVIVMRNLQQASTRRRRQSLPRNGKADREIFA